MFILKLPNVQIFTNTLNATPAHNCINDNWLLIITLNNNYTDDDWWHNAWMPERSHYVIKRQIVLFHIFGMHIMSSYVPITVSLYSVIIKKICAFAFIWNIFRTVLLHAVWFQFHTNKWCLFTYHHFLSPFPHFLIILVWYDIKTQEWFQYEN